MAKSRVIQFSHSGGEYRISTRKRPNDSFYQFEDVKKIEGIRLWNRFKDKNPHYRKFMRLQGEVLLNNGLWFDERPIKEDLLFWGEWEAPSKFKILNNKRRDFPSAIHEPFVDIDERLAGKHNTDPYIFGNDFYYTNCKQASQSIANSSIPTEKYMYQLANGSLIFFGSEIRRKERTGFVIDTVFVVEDSVPFSSSDNGGYSIIFKKVNLELVNMYCRSAKLKIFKGQMYYQNKDIFSYVPCKLYSQYAETGFERPIIDFEKFGLQKPGAGTLIKEILDVTVSEYWSKLTQEIINQGFSLAICLDEPPIKKK